MSLSVLANRLLGIAIAEKKVAAEITAAIDAGTAANLNTASLGAPLVSTAAQIDAIANPAARIVAVGVSATTFAITQALHSAKIVNVNTTVPIAITLPAASASGATYSIRLSAAATTTGHTIKVANTVDVMQGFTILAQTDTAQVCGFVTTATDDTITINGTTKGGYAGGTDIQIIDFAAGVFQVRMLAKATGTVVTPFSATV